MLSPVVCLVLLTLPSNIFTANPDFRSDYAFDSASQAFYKEHPARTWSEAVSECAAEGAQLAAPRTRAQVRALTRRMRATTASVWVGISDLLAQGSYMTLDGFSASEIYMKWKQSEPTNFGGNENCLQMDRAGKYNDTLCDLECNFICKKELIKEVTLDECTTVYCVEPPRDIKLLGKESKKDFEGEKSAKPFFRHDYTYESAFTAFYKGHREVRTWSEAVSACAAEGAELAAAAEEGESRLLVDLMHDPDLWAGIIWLGIHDTNSEGRFNLLNGSAIRGMNWAAGQPDNHGGNENCVQMVIQGQCDDVSCEKRLRFVCKKDLSTVSRTNSICESHDTEYVYSLDADRCYKFHTSPRTWHDALKICLAEGAQLGILNSEAEAKIYQSTIRSKIPSSIQGVYNRKLLHLGFTDLLSPGEFKSVKGETLRETGYDKWYTDQPDNHGGNEHCGSMVIEDARLNDIGCQTRAMFICEKTIGRPLSLESTTLKSAEGEVTFCLKD